MPPDAAAKLDFEGERLKCSPKAAIPATTSTFRFERLLLPASRDRFQRRQALADIRVTPWPAWKANSVKTGQDISLRYLSP
jgi:hypothetical protein